MGHKNKEGPDDIQQRRQEGDQKLIIFLHVNKRQIVKNIPRVEARHQSHKNNGLSEQRTRAKQEILRLVTIISVVIEESKLQKHRHQSILIS